MVTTDENYKQMSDDIEDAIDVYEYYIDSEYAQEYWLLNPEGTYSYIFKKEFANKIYERIYGKGLKRKLGYLSIRSGEILTDKIYNFVPYMEKISIKQGNNHNLDYAIIGPKAVFIDIDSYVFITGDDNMVGTEINSIMSLPDEVPVPTMLDYNEDKNYYTLSPVDGYEAKEVDESWEDMKQGFQNIKPIYDINNKTVDINEFIMEIENSISDTELDYRIYESAIKIAKDRGIPSHINKSQIHRDFHPRNIIIESESKNQYIIDWSSFRQDYIILDMYLAYHNVYIDNGNIKPFVSMIEGKGKYHDQHKDMVDTIGEKAYNEQEIYEGLPILYLLYALTVYEVDSHKRTSIEILSEICDIY